MYILFSNCSQLFVYKGRSIKKLQNGAVSLIFKLSKIQNVPYVANLFWNTLWEFVNDDTATSLADD